MATGEGGGSEGVVRADHGTNMLTRKRFRGRPHDASYGSAMNNCYCVSVEVTADDHGSHNYQPHGDFQESTYKRGHLHFRGSATAEISNDWLISRCRHEKQDDADSSIHY